MPRIDFKKAFYESKINRDTFLDKLDGVVNSEVLTLRAIPFGCLHPINEYFSDLDYANRSIQVISSAKGLHLFKLRSRRPKEKGAKALTGLFYIYEHPQLPNIFVAFTIDSSDFFRLELFPFIKSLYPNIILSSIKHRQLKSFIEEFKISNGYSEIKITRASSQLRVHSESEDKIVSAVTWSKMTLEEAFKWVYENNGWFKSLQFEPKKANQTHAQILITRRGIVKTDRYFKSVFNSFIEPICKTLNGNMNLLKNRSRKENPEFSVKPLVIEFESEVFENIEENKTFIDAIKTLKSASISVLHGNPYIHISMLDYLDGSSFDLWALNNNQLVIVPQMKGTVESIKRLVNHIYDSFAEGEMKDYEETLSQ